MKESYDYIFVGNGASSSLLIHALHKRNLLHCKSVLILDGDLKNKNDRTFCFWASEKDQIVEDFGHIIQKSWNKMELFEGYSVSLEPLQYHFISGMDLYVSTKKIVDQYSITRLSENADIVASNKQGKYVIANGVRYTAHHIFDSRPPKYFEPKEHQTFMLQSFIGWFIQTELPIQHKGVMHWMDFEIDQQGCTQFMYVLPMSDHEVLVEMTRFGTDVLQDDAAFPILHDYIQSRFGEYEIKETEMAAIPMTNCQMAHSERVGVTTLGARAGMLNPTTGYAFKNMYQHANEIAQTIAQHQDNLKLSFKSRSHVFRKTRFDFYDALLLIALTRWPQMGKSIFTSLLSKISLSVVLRFLDQETSWKEEVKIFYHLPWTPFLKALHVWSKRYYSTIGIYLFILLTLTMRDTYPIIDLFGLLTLLIGLILVGIPHGALDHLVESCVFGTKRFFNFLGLYLLMMGLMATIWMFHPTLALIIFLLYSAIHFGQTDGIEWGMSNILSAFWGATLLWFILGTHQIEAQNILESMGYTGEVPDANGLIIIPWMMMAIFTRQWSMMFTLFWIMFTVYLPLTFAFGLYFIFQHSALGWTHLKNRLQLTHIQMWKQSLIFQLGAWIFLLVYHYFWPIQAMNNTKAWSVFFIFLSSLSFPHVLAMLRFYKRNGVVKV